MFFFHGRKENPNQHNALKKRKHNICSMFAFPLSIDDFFWLRVCAVCIKSYQVYISCVSRSAFETRRHRTIQSVNANLPWTVCSIQYHLRCQLKCCYFEWRKKRKRKRSNFDLPRFNLAAKWLANSTIWSFVKPFRLFLLPIVGCFWKCEKTYDFITVNYGRWILVKSQFAFRRLLFIQ